MRILWKARKCLWKLKPLLNLRSRVVKSREGNTESQIFEPVVASIEHTKRISHSSIAFNFRSWTGTKVSRADVEDCYLAKLVHIFNSLYSFPHYRDHTTTNKSLKCLYPHYNKYTSNSSKKTRKRSRKSQLLNKQSLSRCRSRARISCFHSIDHVTSLPGSQSACSFNRVARMNKGISKTFFLVLSFCKYLFRDP